MGMRLKKGLVFVLAFVLSAAVFAGCEIGQDDNLPLATYYTVTFDLDGGTIANKDVSKGIKIKSGSSLALSDYTPSKDQHTFSGWTAGDKTYAATDSLKVAQDIALAAQWSENEKETFTVTFDPAGGDMAETTASVKKGETLAFAEFAPTREPGYVFAGWQAADGTVYALTDSVEITAAETFTALWRLDETPAEQFVFDYTDGSKTAYKIIGLADGFDLETLVIPKKYNGLPVTEIAESALAGATRVKTFIAQKGLIKVAPTAFANMAVLESLTMPFVGTEAVITDSMRSFEGNVGYLFAKAAGFSETEEGYYSARQWPINGLNSGFLIPETLTTFTLTSGDFHESWGALRNFASLTAVNLLSDEITVLPKYVMDSCKNLKSLDLTACVNLESVDVSALNWCKALETVSFSGLTKLKSIGQSAFAAYYNYDTGSSESALKSVDLSGCTALTEIDKWAFQYSTLPSIDLSGCTALKTFGSGVFANCTELETVKLPVSLETVTSDAFAGCTKLQSLTVGLSPYLYSENGVLYDADQTQLIKYPAKSTPTAFVAPETLVSIGASAFEASENLTEIDLSQAKITSIAYNAFAGCVNAALTVPFDRYGYYLDGTKVTLANSWYGGVPSENIHYGERYLFFEITVSGITDGMKTAESEVSFSASATYGDDMCAITVTVNGGAPVTPQKNNQYVVPLESGENEIVIKAAFDGKTDEKTFAVNRAEKPTVKTTVEDGKTYTGQYLEFDVTAKDASGNALNKDAVKIKTNWGYGLNDLTSMALEMTDVGDKVHVKIDFDTLWDMGFYSGGNFVLAVVVSDGGVTAQAEYTVEHVQE